MQAGSTLLPARRGCLAVPGEASAFSTFACVSHLRQQLGLYITIISRTHVPPVEFHHSISRNPSALLGFLNAVRRHISAESTSFDPLTAPQAYATLRWKVPRREWSMIKRDPIDPDAVYSREEVAELLGVSLSTIKRLISARQLEVSRPESIRRIFIKGSSILSMLEETKIEAVR